jgi:diguanylate cyclase (GGDEF)-like protein
MSNMPVQLPQALLTITVSIGVVVAVNEMSSIDDMLRKADEAMYQAKRHGGNYVLSYEDISNR